MKKAKNSFLIVIVAIVLFVGFSFNAIAQNDMGKLTPVKVKVSCDKFQMKEDVSRSVKLAEHGRLVVTLCTNPSTGYNWPDSAQISNHSVLWQTSHTTSSNSGSALGSPGKAKWEFEALDEGKSTISLEYGRSWQADGGGNWSFSLQVTVIDEDDIDDMNSDGTDSDSTGEKLVKELFKDIEQSNISALRSRISGNFQCISESGITNRKGEIKAIQDSELEDFELSEFHSTRQNDTLVVTYKLKSDKSVGGEDAEDEPVNQLSVFVKTDSGWEWIVKASAD